MKKVLKLLSFALLLSLPFVMTKTELKAQPGHCKMDGGFVAGVFYCPLMFGESPCVGPCKVEQ
jgi:hypothetical protein